MGKYLTGLKNFHVAELLTDEKGVPTTYDVVKPLSEAISVSVTPNVATGQLHGDNEVVDTASKFNSAEVAINVTSMTATDEAILYGRTIDTDGTIGSKGTIPYLALGYEATYSDDTSEFWWLYKGKFQEATRSYNTQNDSVEYQTPTVNGTFIRRRFDSEWKRNSGPDFTDGPIWFDEVYERTPVV